MINAYRVRGHLLADLDPLEYKVSRHPELDPQYYGFTLWDLDRQFVCGGLCGKQTANLRDILDTLRETYCGKIAPEYMHMQETVQKRWLQDRMEPARNKQPLDGATKRRILMKLNDSEAFEKFLHTKYVGHKRFSMEGAESSIPMLDYLFNEAAADGVVEGVIGMAHRGRLNVLANTLGKSYEQIFREFEGDIDPNSTRGLRRREVSPRRRRHSSDAIRLAHAADAGLESIAPRSGRSDRRRNGPREAEAPRRQESRARAAGPAPRRCGVRGSGRRRGDTEPLAAQRLSHRRHDSRRHQQPDRLHHRTGVSAFVDLRDRCREDGAGSDLPRERRRSRGLHSRDEARV